jgi:hypothetical protein
MRLVSTGNNTIANMKHLGAVRFGLVTICCKILILRALSFSSSSGSMAAAFLFNELGIGGIDALMTWFTILVKCGSGSKHKGPLVASCTVTGHSGQ